MTHIERNVLTRDGTREQFIKLKITGPIPEKEWELTRKNGIVKQVDGQTTWETNIRNSAKKYGWLNENPDAEYDDAYTPLCAKLYIHGPENAIIIKQAKAIGDALADAIYINDCVINDLTIEYVPDDEYYLVAIYTPAHKEDMRVPHTCQTVKIDRPLRLLKGDARDEAGYILDAEKKKMDDEFIDYVQALYFEQTDMAVYDELEITAIIAAATLGKRLPASEKRKRLNLEILPTSAPDCDNLAYSIIKCLEGLAFINPTSIKKIRVFRTWRIDDENVNNTIYLKGIKSA